MHLLFYTTAEKGLGRYNVIRTHVYCLIFFIKSGLRLVPGDLDKTNKVLPYRVHL